MWRGILPPPMKSLLTLSLQIHNIRITETFIKIEAKIVYHTITRLSYKDLLYSVAILECICADGYEARRWYDSINRNIIGGGRYSFILYYLYRVWQCNCNQMKKAMKMREIKRKKNENILKLARFLHTRRIKDNFYQVEAASSFAPSWALGKF